VNCLRCGGFMIPVRMTEVPTSESIGGRRCLLCGEMTDSVIEANRRSHQEPRLSGARVPGSSIRPVRTTRHADRLASRKGA
jgi:hypothetical protein